MAALPPAAASVPAAADHPAAAASPVSTASAMTAPPVDIAPADAPTSDVPAAGPVTIASEATSHPAVPTDQATAETPDRAASDAVVQFAATASEESARSFWQNLVRRFPDVLGQRSPVVTRYEREGTVFWRVRTDGFDTVSEAQTLCSRMRAGGQDCFVPKS